MSPKRLVGWQDRLHDMSAILGGRQWLPTFYVGDFACLLFYPTYTFFFTLSSVAEIVQKRLTI